MNMGNDRKERLSRSQPAMPSGGSEVCWSLAAQIAGPSLVRYVPGPQESKPSGPVSLNIRVGRRETTGVLG